MEENKLIKYDNKQLQRLDSLVAVTQKFLLKSDRKSIVNFFILRPIIFRRLISNFYPLQFSQLLKFKNFLHWGSSGVSNNYKINWNEDLIEEFSGKLSWNAFTHNEGVYFTSDLIDKYYQKFENCSWANLSSNRNFVFSEELIDKFINKWDWNYLSSNRGIAWTDILIENYKSQINWNGLSENTSVEWSDHLIGKYQNNWNWHMLSANMGINWNDVNLFEKYKSKIYYHDLIRNSSFNCTLEFIKRFDLEFWDWENLAENLSIWDENTIDVFFNKLDFKILSYNNNLRWSQSLIEKYKNYWDWEILSGNSSLPFSKKFIVSFDSFWDWKKLTTNYSLPWSIDLIEYFKNKWDWNIIGYQQNKFFLNEGFWKKGFQNYLDDEMIEEIFIKINE